MMITRCLIDHNVALSTTGGGIVINNEFNDAFATITNTTISHNTAPAGGGIFASNVASLDLDHCTITGNTSTLGTGGGIRGPGITGAILRMHNTIVADNTAPAGAPDCVGTITSLGYNLIGNAGGCTMVGGYHRKPA